MRHLPGAAVQLIWSERRTVKELSADESGSTTLSRMSKRSAKKPLAIFGTLGTMAAVWWFALRPRRKP